MNNGSSSAVESIGLMSAALAIAAACCLLLYMLFDEKNYGALAWVMNPLGLAVIAFVLVRAWMKRRQHKQG